VIDAQPGELLDLFDGTPARLRSIRPDDAAALRRFHGGLHPETVRRRFLGYHPQLSTGEVERFTDVDGADRLALVVCTNSDLLAVARYERDARSATAEVAFVVADACQHHGIGPLLLERLAERARAAGIRTFTAQTLVENAAMLAVFRASGYFMRMSVEAGVVDVSLDICVRPPGTAAGSARYRPLQPAPSALCRLDGEGPAELLSSSAYVAETEAAR
jgi:GNAT superfamily N-acetyltransferase